MSLYAQSQTTEIDSIDRLQALQANVRELERSRGNYDPSLIETLRSLADAAAAANLYAEADAALERAIQIRRHSSGLFASEQIPLYFSKMENNHRANNWQAINQSLDYVRWLLLQKYEGSGEDLIHYLIKLSELHLLGVAEDRIGEQAGHYREAAELNLIALELSEALWGAQDLRRLDLYYSLIKQFYLQSVAVQRGGETGYALRAIVPESNWVKPKNEVQNRYYLSGLRLFDEMREVITGASGVPPESLALVDLYEADWHLLFNQEIAETAYGEAFSALLQAGNPSSDLNRLFARPQILPIASFHNSLDQALRAARTPEAEGNHITESEDSVDSFLQVQEWFDRVPIVPFPFIAPALGQTAADNYADAMLHFRLNTLEKVTRWVQGTLESHRGVVEEFTIMDRGEGQALDLEQLNQRLHSLFFRPRLEDGIVQPYEGKLLYRIALD